MNSTKHGPKFVKKTLHVDIYISVLMMLKNNKVTDFIFTIYSIQSDVLVLYTHKSTIAG